MLGMSGMPFFHTLGNVLSRSCGVSGAEIAKAEKSAIHRNKGASSRTIQMPKTNVGAGDAATAPRTWRRLRVRTRTTQWVSQGEWGAGWVPFDRRITDGTD